MPLRDTTYQLFNYLAQVYSIDLPVIRDVTKYGAEIWWLADQARSSQCKIREFDQTSVAEDNDTAISSQEPEAWLTVTKRQYDPPPSPPAILVDWISVPINPTKQPSANMSIIRRVNFHDDPRRVEAFSQYQQLWHAKDYSGDGRPEIPEVLEGWIELSQE